MDIAQVTPIRWPEGFPPKQGAAKFFLGVRWIGPDISFFEGLRRNQKERTNALLELWGGGLRQEIAGRIGRQLYEVLRWPNGIFIPDDSWKAICHGPRFDSFDEQAAVVAINDFEQHYGLRIPPTFWDVDQFSTFGDVVDRLVKLLHSSAAQIG